MQNEGNNESVGHDGGYRKEPFTLASQQVGESCANQCREASENDIGQNTANDDIAEDTADKYAGDRSRCEGWKDGERFGYPNLDFTVGKWCEHEREHHVDSGNHSRMCHKQHFVVSCVFHFLFSCSFVLREEGLELTIHLAPEIGGKPHKTLVFMGFATVHSVPQKMGKGKGCPRLKNLISVCS